MGRAVSQKIIRFLTVLLVGWIASAGVAQQATLPSGIQGASSLSASQRDRLAAFIAENVRLMQEGTRTQQSAARDQLIEMFDAPAVSTAFRQAASEQLRQPIDTLIGSSSRWEKFAGYRIAARLATQDSARIFAEAIRDTSSKGDLLMALGQVRVFFLEADTGGLAVSATSLADLAIAIGQQLAETPDPDVALLQTRALRALAESRRSDFASARAQAVEALADAIAARMAARDEPAGVDELLVELEAIDGVRGYLVSRQAGQKLGDEAAALGRLSGQSLAFVTRTYESTPDEPDSDKRSMQRLAQRAMEIVSFLITDYNSNHASNTIATRDFPDPRLLAKWLQTNDMNSFKLSVIGSLDALAKAYGFQEGWAKLD